MNDLLRPSLAREDDGPRLYPYSARALMLTAFIGGPLALAGLLGHSAWRTHQLAREVPLLALLTGAGATVLFVLAAELVQPPGLLAPFSLSPSDVRFALRHGGRLLALGAVAIYYFRHRRLYRALESLGQVSPPGTLPAIVCVVMARALQGAVLFLLFRITDGFLL